MKTTKTESLLKLLSMALKKEMEKKLDEKLLQLKKELIQQNATTNEYLTANVVCSKFCISSSTLERYVRNGLKYSSNGKGCKRLFKKIDVENFITQRNGR